MKVFIPTVGTELELSVPWRFQLYQEYRNNVWIEKLRAHKMVPPPPASANGLYSRYSWAGDALCEFMLPTGTKLKVARVYIRGAARSFDSVTFNSSFEYNNSLIKGRFWAKLADVNNMEVVDK